MMQAPNAGTVLYIHVSQPASIMATNTTLVLPSTRERTYGKDQPMYTDLLLPCMYAIIVLVCLPMLLPRGSADWMSAQNNYHKQCEIFAFVNISIVFFAVYF